VTSVLSVDTFEHERPRLFALAYAFLGSRADAADAIQDAWLRWHGRTDSVRDPAAWLTTVVSRLALDRLRSAHARRETYPGVWLPEPVAEAPSAEETAVRQADLSIAFLFLLERLAPEERAAFVLREVFDHPYSDIAAALEKSEAACRQMVTRARERVRRDQVRQPVDPTEFQNVLGQYVAAIAAGDERALLNLLAPDAILYGDGGGKALAVINPLTGPDRIIRFLLGLRRKYPGQYEFRPTTVNGSPGFRLVREGHLIGISAFEILEGRIKAIYNLLNPDKLKADN
jgi:RNA polymerase sigma-70 factor (ECF subfamily)